METLRQLSRNRALLTFMLGHFTVDMYGGLLPVLYPLMALEFGLTKGDVGLVALSFTAASSLSQPLFGWVADRFGSRALAPSSLVWAACMFAMVGLSQSRGFLMVAACMAGLGSGAYHPVGASNAAVATGDLQKNTAMSLYTIGGTAGYALGPILGAGLFAVLGGQGSMAMLPVGVVAATLVRRSFTRLGLGLPDQREHATGEGGSIPWRQLAPVVGVTMLRSWVSLALVTYIPLWYEEMGYASSFYGPLTAVVIGAGAIGTLIGGILADRVGQRRVLLVSLGLAIPALFLFVGLPGPIALLTGALFGLFADASLSITLVMAQRLLPGRIGMASGFILGIGFVTGGIGVPITGMIADQHGTPAALMLLSVLLVLAAVSATLIPWRLLQATPSLSRSGRATAND